jgi:hypothetical protein
MSTLILDNFTAANGTALSGRAPNPTNTPGHNWASYGTFDIQSNRANCTALGGDATRSMAHVDSGAADATVSVVVNTGSSKIAGCIVRWVDSDNFILAFIYPFGGLWRLLKRVGGTFTQLDTASPSLSDGVDYTISVTTSGTSITATLDGGNTLSGTEGTLTAATHHGFYHEGSTGGSRWDNFQVDVSTVPLDAGTCSATVASDTSATMTGGGATGGTATYTFQAQYNQNGGGWTNFGSAQTGVAASTPPTPVTVTGLTFGASVAFRWHVTDSAGSPATADSTTATLLIRTPHTYYFDTSGSDSNDGLSTGAAFQTITKANSWGMIPGDTFSFKGGQTFTGNLLVASVAGTRSLPVTVGSYGTGRATISCGDSYGVRFTNCSHVIVSDLIISGGGVNSNGSSSSHNAGVEVINTANSGQLTGVVVDNIETTGTYAGVFIRGNSASGTNASASGFTDVRVTNCYCHEHLYFGIKVSVVPLQDRDGTALTWDQFDLQDTRGTVVGDVNTTSNNFLVWKGSASGSAFAFDDVYVADCVVQNVYGNSAWVDLNTGNGIVFNNVRDAVRERNRVEDCGAHGNGTAGQWNIESIRVKTRFGVVLRQKNISMATAVAAGTIAVDGDAYNSDGGCTDCTFEYCYSSECHGAAILAGDYPGSALSTGTVYRYSISVNDCRGDTGSTGMSVVHPYSGAHIVLLNNFIYLDATGSAGTPTMMRDVYQAGNNVFVTAHGADFFHSNLASSSFINNLWHAVNTFALTWNNSGGTGGTVHASLSAWRTASGQEVYQGANVGLSTDPLVSSLGSAPTPTRAVDVTAYDPASGSSPTVGAGLDMSVVFGADPGQVDYHGLPNRANASATSTGYDIGPVKYGAAAFLNLPPLARAVIRTNIGTH